MSWLPIESAPKSLEEIFALYGDRFAVSVLIGRADQPLEHGCIPGCVGECTLVDGRWVAPTSPELRQFGGDEYTEIVAPTHWQPLPELPQ